MWDEKSFNYYCVFMIKRLIFLLVIIAQIDKIFIHY